MHRVSRYNRTGSTGDLTDCIFVSPFSLPRIPLSPPPSASRAAILFLVVPNANAYVRVHVYE